jgi:hypothetical protein
VSTTANVPQATCFQEVFIMTHDTIHPDDIAYVVPESREPNLLREGAGTDKTVIAGGGIPLGRPMLIISGPTEVAGLDSKGAFMVNWWYVEALCKDGVRRRGYTAERDPKERLNVFLKPYRDGHDSGKSLLKTTLSHASQAKVVSDYVNIRPQPNTVKGTIGKHLTGATFKVYGYPRCDDQGRIWWSETEAQSVPGRWVCEVDKDDVRYLKPV